MDKHLKDLESGNDQFTISFAKNLNYIDHNTHKKYGRFIQDDDQVSSIHQHQHQHQKIHNPQTIKSHPSETHFTHHQINDQSVSLNNKFSPDMVNLLQSCKISIQSLQKQLAQKNQEIIKLKSDNQSLRLKLNESQKQVQRTHEILRMYIKQSQIKVKQFVTVSECFENPEVQINFKSQIECFKHEIQKHKQISEKMMAQNKFLYLENYQLKAQIHKLNSQINYLEQKVYKMGKGVGKALSTIKKNNIQSIQYHNLQFNKHSISQNKQQSQNARNKINGKIIFKRLQLFTDNEINYQTPLKKENHLQSVNKEIGSTIHPNIQSKETFQTEKYQRKMKQISNHAKKIDKIDRIELLLNKMQQLSKSQDSSQEFHD